MLSHNWIKRQLESASPFFALKKSGQQKQEIDGWMHDVVTAD
jgi:hypothetical protein